MATVWFDKNDMGSLLITGNEDELAKVLTFINNSINSNDAIKKAFGDEDNNENMML